MFYCDDVVVFEKAQEIYVKRWLDFFYGLLRVAL
jgi:hypothetical protein